ncbi:MAG: hypothetical protein ABSE73_22290 [Planctomycetota bacterium]
MRRVETGDPGKLAYIEGGGGMALFLGLPFLATGPATVFAALTGHVKTDGGQPGGVGLAIFWALAGLFFACSGAAFAFGRRGVVFDKSKQTVKRWYGLLIPMWSRVHEIKQFREVSVSKEVLANQDHNSSNFIYPVRLTGPNAGPLDLWQTRDERQALKQAEEVALFINLHMANGLGGVTVRREAGTVDEPLRERLKRLGQGADIPPPPLGLRTEFSARGNAVLFTIPPPGFKTGDLVSMVWMGTFAGFVAPWFLWRILTGKNVAVALKLFSSAFIGIVFIMSLALTIVHAVLRLKRRAVVEVDSYSLRVTLQGAFFSKHVEIPGEELEELLFEKHQGEYCLTAMSKKWSVRFGQGLPRPELEWIRAVALKALAAD